MNIDELRAICLVTEGSKAGMGATHQEIETARKTLGVDLPRDYVDFLLAFGWLSIGPFDVYGLGEGVPLFLNLVTMTVSEREEAEPALPLYLLPLMNDGFGNHYCLDTLQIENGVCPVVFWDHEQGPSQVTERICPDFMTWLDSLINDF